METEAEPKPTKPAPKLPRVRHASLVELAHRSIRESITSGRLPMGSRLVEARLAEELGISRGPIREALRRLRAERLVLERPRHGTFVREFGAQDIVDIYNLRLAVESAAIRLAVRRRAPTRRLETLITQMAASAEKGDVPGVVDAEFAFHEELCAASGNDYLLGVYQNVSAQIRMALSLDNAAYAELGDVAREHEGIVEQLAVGDEAGAEFTIRSHIVSTIGETLARIGGDPQTLLGPLSSAHGNRGE
jgi:DNA-binding GntR family transcriptional regulator